MFIKLLGQLDRLLWQPANRNLALTMCVFGLMFLLGGYVGKNDTISGANMSAAVAGFFLHLGGIVLGAGVFSSIMKSLQFVAIFQDALYSVIYDPKKVKTPSELLSGWQMITKSLLGDLLPTSCNQAAKKIEATFFNSELDYHYEDYERKYIVDMSVQGKPAKIMCIVNTRIVLSTAADDPKFVHKVDIEKGGEFRLERLVINDDEVPVEGVYAADPAKPTLFVCSFGLKQYERKEEHRPERTVTMSRTVSWEQDLSAEPYIKSTITRYVRGSNLFVKVKGGSLHPHLLVFEIGKPVPAKMSTPDGFDHWVLAKQEDLILPGQGNIILLLP